MLLGIAIVGLSQLGDRALDFYSRGLGFESDGLTNPRLASIGFNNLQFGLPNGSIRFATQRLCFGRVSAFMAERAIRV